MPNYVYECSCGQTLEITHSIHDDPDIECNNCDSMMYRVMQGAHVSFKGAGFYSTDKND